MIDEKTPRRFFLRGSIFLCKKAEIHGTDTGFCLKQYKLKTLYSNVIPACSQASSVS